jgi:hypothetical protein
MKLEDIEDVYKTEEQCEARAREIARQVPYYYKDYRAIKYTCKKLAKGRLT